MSELQEVTNVDLEDQINPTENSMVLSGNENDDGDEETGFRKFKVDDDDDSSDEEAEEAEDADDIPNYDNQPAFKPSAYDEKDYPLDLDPKNNDINYERSPVEKKDTDPQNVVISSKIYDELVVSADETNSDSDDEDDDNESLQKLEQDIDKDLLLGYHPESTFSSYNEVLAQCKIVRDKNGEIIDPLHTTISFLTKYERARILGVRAKQLNNGSDPFITLPTNIIDGPVIALMELKAKKIPFIIRRPLPNGGSEYWKVNDLEILEY
jgi:DNA-directed RNA polymerase I, II, and III subunit RPABC2